MKLKNILSSNKRLKILSFFLAFSAWLAIQSVINFKEPIDIPIEIQAEEGWSVLQQSIDRVSVTLQGYKEDIRLMDREMLRIIVPADGTAGREQNIELKPKYLSSLRRGVRVATFSPDRVTVSLDTESERAIAVQARTTGRPYMGEIETLECDPAVVTLRGPAKLLEPIEWVVTEAIDVDGRSGSFRKRCRVLQPSNLWTAKIDPAEVQVNVNIAQHTASQTWESVAVAALTPPGESVRVSTLPPKVCVHVKGTQESIEAFQKTTPLVFVDCREMDSMLAYELPLKIYVPPGSGIMAVTEPLSVRVLVERKSLP